jgi:photosystem II stability/assembly factor-like uncharacterized protein
MATIPLEPRAVRAVTLIVAFLLALAVVIAAYLRTDLLGRPKAPAPAVASQPDLVSDMTWVSYQEGWLAAVDHVAGRTTLFHTTDAGRHWARQRVGGGLESADFFDAGHGLLYDLGPTGQPAPPGGAAGVSRTLDGGRHWQRVTLPRGAAGRRPAFADAAHAWVWSSSPAGLYATGDGGAHWWRQAAAGLPVSPRRPEILGFRDAAHGWMARPAGSTAPDLWATADGGATWTPAPLPSPAGGWPGSRFEVGPVAIASDGHGQVTVTELQPWDFTLVPVARWVAATADGGATWSVPERMPDVPPGTLVGVSTSRAEGAVSWAWSAGELLVTRDGGGHWAPLPAPASWYVSQLRVVDARTAWAAASVLDGWGNARWRLFSTRDAGATWTEVAPPSLA